jgi:hypothetical protein
VNGEEVMVKINRKSLVWDVACQIEEQNYQLDVAHPKVTEDGEKVDGTCPIKRTSKYHFCKFDAIYLVV